MVTVLMLITVFGWGFLLDRLVKLARQEAGLGKASGGNTAVLFCWVPIVSIFGFCFPRIFLGKDVARKLKEQSNKSHWFNYIRLGAFVYLLLLVLVPVLFAMASLPRR